MPHKSKYSIPLTEGFLTCGPQTPKVLVDKTLGAPGTFRGQGRGGHASILLSCNGNEGFPSMMNIHNTPIVTNENSQLLLDHYHGCYTALPTLFMLITISRLWCLGVRAAARSWYLLSQ